MPHVRFCALAKRVSVRKNSMENQPKTKLTVPKEFKYHSADDCNDLIVELNSFTHLEVLELSGASFGLDACKLIAENLHRHDKIKVLYYFKFCESNSDSDCSPYYYYLQFFSLTLNR